MRRLVLALALVGLVASPALAELAPSAYTPKGIGSMQANGHTVGLYDGAGGIYLNVSQPAAASDVFTVEFAFHWPFSGSDQMIQFQSAIIWDNDEIQLTSVTPYGTFPAWGAANYGGTSTNAWFAGITNTGVLHVGDVLGTGTPLWQNPSGLFGGSTTTIVGSQVIPFMQIQFHVRNPVDDGYLDLAIASAAVLYTVPGAGTYWTGGQIGAASYGIAITPEPASLTLLAGGLLAVGTGIWRRRR